MKTKSYRIYNNYDNWVEVSETKNQNQIKLHLQTGGVIILDHKAWTELCSMKYELQCNEPGMEASQVPELRDPNEYVATPEENKMLGEHEVDFVLPMADGTINKLRKGIK